MPANDDLDRLLALACEWDTQRECQAFARYLHFRGRGQREAALSALEEFTVSASGWAFEDRLVFAKRLLTQSREFRDVGVLIAQPLHARVLVPTLRQWNAREPREAEPHLWLGLLRCDDPSEHLARALELDPELTIARQTLIGWMLGDVEYNQHELPSLYIHDPRDDLILLDRADALIGGASEAAWAIELRNEANELRERAVEWLKSHPG